MYGIWLAQKAYKPAAAVLPSAGRVLARTRKQRFKRSIDGVRWFFGVSLALSHLPAAF
jgi:hypothetical protein